MGDDIRACTSGIVISPEGTTNTSETDKTSAIPEWMHQFLETQERESRQQRQSLQETLSSFLQGTTQLLSTLTNNAGTNRSDAEFPVNSLQNSNITHENKILFISNPPSKPEFQEGVTLPVRFLQDIEEYSRKLNLNDAKKLECALDGFTGATKDWADLYRAKWNSYEELKGQFLKDFWSDREQLVVRRELYAGNWKEATGESMRSYFARLVLQARTLSPTPADSELVSCLMRHFPTSIQSLWQLRVSQGILDATEFLQGQDSLQPDSLHRNRPGFTANHTRRYLGPYKVDNRPVVVVKDSVPKAKHTQGNDLIGTQRTKSQ